VKPGRTWSTLDHVDPIDLLRLLVDPARLAVVGALAAAGEELDGSELASRAGTDRRTALETVAALVDAGLAVRSDAGFCLDEEGWRTVAAAIATEPEPPDVTIGHGMTADEQAVLAPWFEGRRLSRLPTSRQQRLVVLERLALEFEPGRRYPETAVNSILGQFHDDWSTLRRALVDNGFLDRANNQYWRVGRARLDALMRRSRSAERLPAVQHPQDVQLGLHDVGHLVAGLDHATAGRRCTPPAQGRSGRTAPAGCAGSGRRR
jgi:hypothetical protein